MIFDTNGRIHAHSFELASDTDALPTQPIALTAEEKHYVDSLGVLRIANKSNWPPFDFSYSGLPQGYSTDLVSLLTKNSV